MNHMVRFVMLLSMLLCFIGGVAAEEASPLPEVPARGMVTMLNLGSEKCPPCRMMAPILQELEQEYRGKVAFIFIDVWKHKEQGEKYGAKAVPTQIFFDKGGKEHSRHLGFMSKKSVQETFQELGVK